MVLSDEAIKRPRARDEERLEEVQSGAVSETPKTLKPETPFYESRSKKDDDERFSLSPRLFLFARIRPINYVLALISSRREFTIGTRDK